VVWRLQLETESSERGQTNYAVSERALPLGESQLLDLFTGGGSRQALRPLYQLDQQPVRAGAYNVNGQRSMFNNFLLDGMDTMAYGESNQGFDNQIHRDTTGFGGAVPDRDQQRGRGVRASSGATINVGFGERYERFHADVV